MIRSGIAAVATPRIADYLRPAGDDGLSTLDRELLLAHVLARPRSFLYAHGDDRLSAPEQRRFAALRARRARGEPLAYITGRREFWSLPVDVTPAVLIPRPETELLVEQALALAPAAAAVLELGTGSGAIALALASERGDLRVTATDASAAALNIARRNARHLGHDIDWRLGDWYAPVRSRYSVIVSNPPYVASGDPHLATLAHEPRAALDGGADGLAAIRRIVTHAGDYLLRPGWLVLEHGCDQGPAVRALLRAQGFSDVATSCDLAGLERATVGCWRSDARTSP